MLVYNTVEHDARVRRSARSLAAAGFEVIVLGVAPDGSAGTRTWEGFELRLVPKRDTLAEREVSAARQVGSLKTRYEEPRTKAMELRDQSPPEEGAFRPSDRALQRLYRFRTRRAKLRHERARQLLEEIRHAKSLRAANDPLELEGYEETWWPIVRQLRPDIVHVHDPHGLLVARQAAVLGARWIYDAHEDPLKKGDGQRDLDAALRNQLGEHLQHADAIVTVSEGLADRLVRTFDLRRPPVVVHNTPPFTAGASAPVPGLREQAGVGTDTPLVVYAGSMTSRRRLAVVLEALERLPDVHLALVVSFENKFVQQAVARAKRSGISDRVHLVPKVPPEALVSFIRDADVGVHPLTRYPNADIALPNKLFEYLHAGLPVVVSDCPAMAAFVRRYAIGEVAPVDDPDAWAEAIEHLLDSPPYRDDPEALERLQREWSWERQSDELLGVYRDVLGTTFPGAEARPAAFRVAKSSVSPG